MLKYGARVSPFRHRFSPTLFFQSILGMALQTNPGVM